MSTITKERVANLLQFNSECSDCQANAEQWEIHELARIALASLEAEPVAYVMADDLQDSSIISTPAYRDLGEAMERTVGDVVALYEIPPSQVSLEARGKLSNFVASQEPLGKDFEKVLAENIEGLYVPDNSAPPATVSVPDDVMAAMQKVARIRLDLNDFDGDKRGILDCLSDAEETLIEVVNRRAAMLQGAENAESRCTIQAAPALDSSPKIAESRCSNPQVIPDCSCRTCRPVTFTDSRFVVCPECGNKRCPHANDHRNACTGSNEPDQEGSAYPAAPQQEV
ncbi:hypothetical protein ABKV83_11665 [Enterobacter asburiae]|uniref:hypothetical protein n=1 Tax=Enterobacter asburiae TaxID=61645 RepID=UPI0032AEB74E